MKNRTVKTKARSKKEFEQLHLQVDKIKYNPDNPRRPNVDDKLVALAKNIKVSGVIEPVLVRPDADDKYILVAGHRRLAASIIAGKDIIPVRILTDNEVDFLGTAVSENMLRVDLDTFEIALAIAKLSGMGVERSKLCTVCGLSSQSVSELIRIAKIPEYVRHECIKNGNTQKSFLIQLSKFDSANEAADAYKYYLIHGQLPARKKRSYTSHKGNQKMLVMCLSMLSFLTESKIDYTAEGETCEMVRSTFAKIQIELKKGGWFIPSEFDVSNWY